MDKNYELLKKFSKYILETNNIKVLQSDKEKILEFLYLRFDALIFKIVSNYVLTTAIMKNDKLIIHDESFNNTFFKSSEYKKYKSSGGTSNPASYYGIQEKMYNENNNTKDLLHINFDTNEIRPQIGGGKDHWSKKIILTYIRKILKYHDVRTSKYVKERLLHIIYIHIMKDINMLKKYKKEYTYDTFIKKLKK